MLRKLNRKLLVLLVFVTAALLVYVSQVSLPTYNILQFLTLGVLLGGLYAAAALPFALIFGTMRFFNLAHGELLVLGAYVSYWALSTLHIDPFLSLPLSFVFLLAVGFVYYGSIASRIRKLGVNPTLVASFGLALLLQGLMILICSSDPRAILTEYTKIGVVLGTIVLPLVRIVLLFCSILLIIFVYLFLTKTFLGRACRAVSQDWEAAEMMGINSERIYMWSFLLACGLAGITGTLMGMAYSFEPTIGLRTYLLKSIAVLVLGGVGSSWGILAGGITLGLAEVFGALFLGGGYRDAIAFLLFILVLLFKPSGLFGRVSHL